MKDINLNGNSAYFVKIRAVDIVGLSSILTSNLFLNDTSPPLAGTIYIGLNPKQNVQWSNGNNVKLSWYGFLGIHADIRSYDVGIGTMDNTTDIRLHTHVGLQNHIYVPGILLEHDETYFFHVRAYDAYLLSADVVSSPLHIDTTPPEAKSCESWEPSIELDSQSAMLNWTNYLIGNVTEINGHLMIDGNVHIVHPDIEDTGMFELLLTAYCPDISPVLVVNQDSLPFHRESEDGLCTYLLRYSQTEENSIIVLSSSSMKLTDFFLKICAEETTDNQEEAMYVKIEDGRNVHISWNIIDPESQIKHYSIAVGTIKGANQLYGYQNVGTKAAVRLTNLNIYHGMSFYVTVQAVNHAGGTTTVTSKAHYVDNTPPELVKPSVMSSRHNDSYTVLMSDWSASSDPESGMSHCKWSIGILPVSMNFVIMFMLLYFIFSVSKLLRLTSFMLIVNIYFCLKLNIL